MRAAAAVMVLVHHLLLRSGRDWSSPGWLLWPCEASAAVMIFFVISGYVIGLTNQGAATAATVRDYAWRRFIRLTPINTMAVLLACAAATQWDATTAVTNLLFLQNNADYAGQWVPVIHTNNNLWSLHHEAAYYALFAAVWFFRIRLLVAAGAAGVILLLGWYERHVPVFLACYAAGFLFWLAGLALARHGRRIAAEQVAWPSALLLALVTWKLQLLHHLLSGWRMPLFAGPTVKLYYLDFLPVAVWLVAGVARRDFPLLRWTKVMALTVPALGLAWHYGREQMAPGDLAAASVAYSLALLLIGWRPTLAPFRAAAPIGVISFALYAFARPIECFIFERTALPATAAGFALAALLTVVMSVGLAWFFECRVQPALRRRQSRAAPPPLAAIPLAAAADRPVTAATL